MPRPVALFAVLIVAAGTQAAPGDRGPSPEAVAAGEAFARQVGVAAGMVSREYVRPVETADLYAAAVRGLYEAARRPRPDRFLRELAAAESEEARIDVLVRARAAVDGAPELADGRDLIAALSAFTPILDPHTKLIPAGALSGTRTLKAYGFEFNREAEAAPVPGASSGPARNPGPNGVPPVPFRVTVVKPGSPAQKAGLRPGDLVREIDGIPIGLDSADRAFAALHGPGPAAAEPGAHTLVVGRAGERAPRALRLRLAPFVPESLFGVTRKADNAWDYWLDRERRIAYVRLGAIEANSGEQLSELLHDLGEIRGLIFDLRWCPGGYVDPAVEIASTFLDTGLIARMKYRNRDRGDNSEIHADGGLIRYRAGDFPLLLLVNGETTGGGEMIAAALKDNGRATVAGTRTFGKASIQWTMSLDGLPGYQFKLTGGTYSRPNGKNLQRFPDSKPTDDWGVRPDPGYQSPTSAGLAIDLRELHERYALRPGGSREALELDDPAADPQRLRALKLMRGMVDEGGGR